VDLDIHMSVRGKLVAQDGFVLDQADTARVVNNLLNSFFSQYSLTLNVSVISLKDLYNYMVYLETLSTFGHDTS